MFGDGAFTHRDPRMIVWCRWRSSVCSCCAASAISPQTYFMGYVGRQIVKRLRTQIFERVLRLPVGYFDRNSSAALLSRLTYNTEQVGQAATDSVVVMVRESLTFIGLDQLPVLC